MKEVYILHHVNVFDDETEDVKLLGVYSSELVAAGAIERAIRLEGFKDVPEGFEVSRYEIDVDHWTEGFMTVI